jgi:hypothetical protein
MYPTVLDIPFADDAAMCILDLDDFLIVLILQPINCKFFI